jgi:hypothetical protein
VDKVKDVFSNFVGKVVAVLSFLRTHVDPMIAIILKLADYDNDHIVNKALFPTVVFTLNQHYFNIKSRGAFTDALLTHYGQTIKLSLILGSKTEITHQLLKEVWHDITTLGVTFWYKPHQEVDTVMQIVFLGTPNDANKEEAKRIIDYTLQPLEEHLLATDPQTNPPEVFGLPWPLFAVVSEQPSGQPYKKPDMDKQGTQIQRI